jgi:hypothetical protein
VALPAGNNCYVTAAFCSAPYKGTLHFKHNAVLSVMLAALQQESDVSGPLIL